MPISACLEDLCLGSDWCCCCSGSLGAREAKRLARAAEARVPVSVGARGRRGEIPAEGRLSPMRERLDKESRTWTTLLVLAIRPFAAPVMEGWTVVRGLRRPEVREEGGVKPFEVRSLAAEPELAREMGP